MSLPIVNVFERWSSKKSHKKNNQISVLILGGIVLVLLFTLMSFALTPFGEQFDEDDHAFLEVGLLSGVLGYFSAVSIHLGYELGIYVTIMRLEYLSSHIGEKRPARRMIKINEFSFRPRFAKTALFYSAVFFIFSVRPFSEGHRLVPVFVRDRSNRSRAERVFI